MNTDIEFIVRATACVRLSKLDEEDREVPGDHIIRLPAECVNWTENEVAGRVLDRFHESVAVNELEYFDFEVIDAQGNVLSEFD